MIKEKTPGVGRDPTFYHVLHESKLLDGGVQHNMTLCPSTADELRVG